MKKILIMPILLMFFSFTNAQTKCTGHENDIKNGQIKKATSMGMSVDSISVKYIGNCQYKCISSVNDPGSAYSNPQIIQSTVIFKWEGGKYVFVKKEN